MNGYIIMAENCRKAADKGRIDRGKAEKKARIYDFLGTCDKEDFQILADSGAFNEAMEDYARLALDNAGADARIRDRALNELRQLFSAGR